MCKIANVSVIIPTYSRVKNVDTCLNSILSQRALPQEVILVDDSKGSEIENLARHRKAKFESKTVKLEYIWNRRALDQNLKNKLIYLRSRIDGLFLNIALPLEQSQIKTCRN